MKIRERAEFIDHELARLYPNPPIPLDHTNSYTLLIAVLLSAQCTDARVNKITPSLFGLACNPVSMSKLSVDKINSIVRPCGFKTLCHVFIYVARSQDAGSSGRQTIA